MSDDLRAEILRFADVLMKGTRGGRYPKTITVDVVWKLRQIAGAPTTDPAPAAADPWRLAEWHALPDRCFIRGCESPDADQRGPVFLIDGSIHKACPDHWEPIHRVLGEQQGSSDVMRYAAAVPQAPAEPTDDAVLLAVAEARMRRDTGERYPLDEVLSDLSGPAVREPAAPQVPVEPVKQCSWWGDTKQCPDWASPGFDLCGTHQREHDRLNEPFEPSEQAPAEPTAHVMLCPTCGTYTAGVSGETCVNDGAVLRPPAEREDTATPDDDYNDDLGGWNRPTPIRHEEE